MIILYTVIIKYQNQNKQSDVEDELRCALTSPIQKGLQWRPYRNKNLFNSLGFMKSLNIFRWLHPICSEHERPHGRGGARVGVHRPLGNKKKLLHFLHAGALLLRFLFSGRPFRHVGVSLLPFSPCGGPYKVFWGRLHPLQNFYGRSRFC